MTAIERVNTRIAELELLVEELRTLRDVIENDEVAPLEDDDSLAELTATRLPPANGKPKPKAKKTAASTGGSVAPKGGAAPRVRDLLAKEGPLMNQAIADKLGVHKATVQDALKARPEWFQKQAPGHLKCPWELTEEGQKAGRSAGEFRG